MPSCYQSGPGNDIHCLLSLSNFWVAFQLLPLPCNVCAPPAAGVLLWSWPPGVPHLTVTVTSPYYSPVAPSAASSSLRRKCPAPWASRRSHWPCLSFGIALYRRPSKDLFLYCLLVFLNIPYDQGPHSPTLCKIMTPPIFQRASCILTGSNFLSYVHSWLIKYIHANFFLPLP